MDIKRILGRFFYPRADVVDSARKSFTAKDRVRRKSRNRMARESRRRNRR